MGGLSFAKFIKHGITLTISTDDPMSFGNCLNDEYRVLQQRWVFQLLSLRQFAKNGFKWPTSMFQSQGIDTEN